MLVTILVYTAIFLYGIVIGSFLNVCILRIPGGESIVTKRSHCTKCSHELHWYDLFPLFSYLILRGRCRYCGEKISVQYPVIEAANGILWVATFIIGSLGHGTWLYTDISFIIDSLLICMVISALLVLSVIDFRTYEIPMGVNIFIFIIGCVRAVLHLDNVWEYVIGFFAVSGFLLILYLITKGRGIGGGDIKLMAAAGLFLGWRLSLVAFILGCLYGSVIHIIRMKVTGEGHVLALGPYLSMGIATTLWFGEWLLDTYLALFL